MGCAASPGTLTPIRPNSSSIHPTLEKKNTTRSVEEEPEYKVFNNKFKLEKIRRSRGFSQDYFELQRPFSKDIQPLKRPCNRTNTINSNYLMQLANTLNRNANIEEEDNEDKINEFTNWKLSKKQNGETFWINSGKITLTQEEINNITSKNINEISKEDFVHKEIWFSHYIHHKIINKTDDNPVIVVSRNNILTDSINQFMTTQDFDFKKAMHVYFIDEAALDVGGVYREWFSCLFKAFFNKDAHMFQALNFSGLGRNTIFISEDAPEDKEGIEKFNLFGKLLAKAILDKFTLKQNLNRFLIKSIIKKDITLEDMQYYDLELYETLGKLKVADIKHPDPNFPYVWNVRDKKTKNLIRVDLIPNGSTINLSNENKEKYVNDVVSFIAYKHNKNIIDAICSGFYSVIPNDIVSIFTAEEFDFMLSGQTQIDINDWKNNTEYKGGYTKDSKTVVAFWSILSELNNEDLLSFFTFCTGCAKPPINGFKNLQSSRRQISKFCIEKLEGSNNSLIVAKTCFNRIYLPDYETKEMMQKSIKTILTNNTDLFGIE